MNERTTFRTKSSAEHSFTPRLGGVSQRVRGRHMARNGGEHEEYKKQGEDTLQSTAMNNLAAYDIPQNVQKVLRSPGQSLDAETRKFMESNFVHDFSEVRIHGDAEAADSARAANALAYTVGKNIVFGIGQYALHTSAGRKLIVHELVHVVQQHNGQFISLQRKPLLSNISESAEEEAEATATEILAEAEEQESATTKNTVKKPKPAKDPCTRNILAEGSCADLVAGSRFICCDPDKGFERKNKKTDIEGTPCPDEKFTPIFTCDNNCATALDKGCDDNDNWIAIPGTYFSKKQCNTFWTICANGKQTKGYVRDRSVTKTSFEVSPGIQTALGVTVGSSFKGAIYRPGAKQATIDSDPCCSS